MIPTSLLAAAVVPRPAYASVAPELIFIGGALLLVLLTAASRSRIDAKFYAGYSIVFAAAALIHTIWEWKRVTSSGRHSTFNGSIAHDHYELFFVIVVSIVLIFGALLIERWLDKREQSGPEWFAVAMLSAAGAILIAASNDLVMVFAGLELLSVGLYALVGYRFGRAEGREAVRRTIVPSLLFSAIFIFGASLIYGAVGTTNFSSISTFLTSSLLVDNGLFFVGFCLVLVGLVGKIGAAPFQGWVVDSAVRMPLPVTGLVSALSLLGGGAALLRFFDTALNTQQQDWKPIVMVVAILSLLVGAVGAFRQKELRRMLAFAAISHVGFVLLGLEVATQDGASAALFYLISYAFFVMGCFAVLTLIDDTEDHRLQNYTGLARRHPLVGFAFTILLLAQIGVPLTAGFMAKFYVVTALTEAQSYAAAVFALVAAAALAVPFLRVLAVLYVDPAATTTDDGRAWYEVKYGEASAFNERQPVWLDFSAVWIVLALATVFTLAAGILPEHWFNVIGLVKSASSDLF